MQKSSKNFSHWGMNSSFWRTRLWICWKRIFRGGNNDEVLTLVVGVKHPPGHIAVACNSPAARLYSGNTWNCVLATGHLHHGQWGQRQGGEGLKAGTRQAWVLGSWVWPYWGGLSWGAELRLLVMVTVSVYHRWVEEIYTVSLSVFRKHCLVVYFVFLKQSTGSKSLKYMYRQLSYMADFLSNLIVI